MLQGRGGGDKARCLQGRHSNQLSVQGSGLTSPPTHTAQDRRAPSKAPASPSLQLESTTQVSLGFWAGQPLPSLGEWGFIAVGSQHAISHVKTCESSRQVTMSTKKNDTPRSE